MMNNFSSPGGDYGGAGAGFMKNESPMGGGGGGAGGKGSAQAKSVTATTLRQLLAGTMHGEQLHVDGRDLVAACVVAQVTECKVLDTHQELVINDSTGAMLVQIWPDGSESGGVALGGLGGAGGDATTPFTMASGRAAAAAAVGDYVRVVGHVREFDGRRSLVAHQGVKRITDFNEITFHALNAIYVHLVNTRGGAPQHAASGASATAQTSPMGGAHGVGVGGALAHSAVPMSGGAAGGQQQQHVAAADVKELVQKTIREMSTGYEGVAIDAVVVALKPHAAEHVVRDAVAYLSAQGALYQTVDEQHFNVANC